jgi:outer membrane protein OmpA-like peptidoglycan-associated protein
VTGYADSVGNLEYNRTLSKKRALFAYQVLRSHKVPVDNEISYKGEEFEQDSDIKKNRKVEIIAYKIVTGQNYVSVAADSVIESFDLHNVFFVPDRPIIVQESIQRLPPLAAKLKAYNNVHFEIVGHVNYQSKSDSAFLKDLFKLSEQRARVIYEYLIEHGVPADLLRYKGVGNTQPVVADPTNDDERKKNMRVQILVIKTRQQM